MKLGLAVPNYGKFADVKSISQICKMAEKLRYDSLWVSDHIVVPKGHKGFGNVFYDPLVTLSYIAAITKKIKLGTSVIVLPYRNPVVLAKEVSTLDVQSEGRVILGIGAGWLKEEFEALGINYDERGSITDEYIEIIKELYTNESPGYKGKFHEFSDIDFYPKPVQIPYPPIWIGGNSKSALKRAVRYGNGWHAVGITPDEVTDKRVILNRLFSENNKSDTDFIVSVRKSLQVTTRKIRDKEEVLRGSLVKIKDSIEQYKDAGVDCLVLQILDSKFNGVIETMEAVSEIN